MAIIIILVGLVVILHRLVGLVSGDVDVWVVIMSVSAMGLRERVAESILGLGGVVEEKEEQPSGRASHKDCSESREEGVSVLLLGALMGGVCGVSSDLEKVGGLLRNGVRNGVNVAFWKRDSDGICSSGAVEAGGSIVGPKPFFGTAATGGGDGVFGVSAYRWCREALVDCSSCTDGV
jgi:hypothetical protein